MSQQGYGDFDLSGFSAPPTEGWPPAAKVTTGCGLGCVSLVLLQSLAIWAMFSAIGKFKGSFQAPARVVVGKPFPLKITLRNRSAEPLLVNNVALERKTATIFTLTHPQPAPSASTTTLGVTTWTYTKHLAPGEVWTLQFNATVRDEGEQEGTLTVQAPFVPEGVHFRVTAVKP